VLPTNVILLTDENFVSFAAGGGLPWYRILGVADTATFKSGRIFGLAAQSDSVLVAWGSDMVFRLAVVGSDGSLVARADQAGFFGPFGSQTATAMAYGGGLLMFDGNPVRLTQIGFDLSRQPLGQNDQLLTFDETSAQIAPITLLGDPIAFWLTVFPGIDASQSATTHQLYGCALDRGDPKSCASTALIAATGLGGPGIGDEPVAAAALPDDSAFALAHTDVYGQSWLRIANMSCAQTSVP
jgi:hypothetical protein